MNLNEYQTAALRTAKMFPTRYGNMNHAALGMITEIGEFATEVKRMSIYAKPLDDERRTHMIEEIGDFAWYVAIGAHAIGMTLQGAYNVDPAPGFSNPDDDLDGITETAVFLIGTYCVMVMAEKINAAWVLADVAKMFSVFIQMIDVIAQRLDTTRESIFETNIAKLRKRFPEKYSDQAAEARADKEGADARSS